jgi:hypothetical protein
MALVTKKISLQYCMFLNTAQFETRYLHLCVLFIADFIHKFYAVAKILCK